VAKIVFVDYDLPYTVTAVMAAPNLQNVMVPVTADGENIWRYNELNVFGTEEAAKSFFEKIGLGASLIIGSKAFMELSKGDIFVAQNMEREFYDAAISKIISVDEKVLASSSQNSIEAFLNAKGDLEKLDKNFGNIMDMYKAIFGDENEFDIEFFKRKFNEEEISGYLLFYHLSKPAIESLSNYLTIMSMYDAYTMTGNSFEELLNCMEEDGYEKEFVTYAKQKLKLFDNKEELVINSLKNGGEKALKGLISTVIKNISKKGIEALGAKLDISNDMQKVFNSKSASAIGAKMLYDFVISSPVVKTTDNYFVLDIVKTLGIYSAYYFDKTWYEAKETYNFYSPSQQKKIKNLAIMDVKISRECFDLLITIFEIQKDKFYHEYIVKTKEIKNNLYASYFKYWYTCGISY